MKPGIKIVRFGTRSLLFALAALWMIDVRVNAQGGTAVREAGELVMKSLGKYFGTTATKEIASEIAEYGGEVAVRQLVQKAVAEGGEQTVQQVAKSVSKFGPETITALQQADQLSPVLKSLDEIPEATVPAALQRLSANRVGKELSQNIASYGTRALKAEVAHPGVGTSLVRSLGDDGLELSEKLTRDEAIVLAQHAEDIAKLSASEKSGILGLIHRDAKSMVGFMGKFVEKNPGKTLFAAGTTAVILAESERILGGDELYFDENGVPHLISKPGLAGRTVEQASQQIVRPIMLYVAPLVALAVGGWLSIKVWYAYRHSDAAFQKERHQEKAKNS